MKKTLFFVVATMVATLSFAQEGRGQQRQRREFNPEDMALRQTAQLHQALQLDSVQYQAIFLMNYADAVTMQDSMKVRRARAEKMQAEGKKMERTRPSEDQMKAMMETQKQREQVRNEQMKQILTAEQYEKYIKMQEEQRNRMRQGFGGQRGNRPGGGQGRMPRQ